MALERRALKFGRPLRRREHRLACLAGVKNPDRIRVLVVESIPMPKLPWARQLAARWGLSMEGVIGLCLRYGIFLRKGGSNPMETLIHECVHTAQYERLGGRAAFLQRYVRECLEFGYADAPMEREAESAYDRMFRAR